MNIIQLITTNFTHLEGFLFILLVLACLEKLISIGKADEETAKYITLLNKYELVLQESDDFEEIIRQNEKYTKELESRVLNLKNKKKTINFVKASKRNK